MKLATGSTRAIAPMSECVVCVCVCVRANVCEYMTPYRTRTSAYPPPHMCVGLWACARVICACELSDSFLEKLQSVVRKPVYRFWNAVPSGSMMCLQAMLLLALQFAIRLCSTVCMVFAGSPSSPTQRIFRNPTCGLLERRWAVLHGHGLQLIPYPCTCT